MPAAPTPTPGIPPTYGPPADAGYPQPSEPAYAPDFGAVDQSSADVMSLADPRAKTGKMVFIGLFSVITIGAIVAGWYFLLYKPSLTKRGVRVEGRKGKGFNPQEQEMLLPDGNIVTLGGRVRLDDLDVKPVRVALEKVTLRKIADPSEAKAIDEKVLVLYLQLTNKGARAFTPLDAKVAWNKINTYIRRGPKGKKGKIELYGLTHESEWEVRGQDTERELMPGATETRFLVADEGSAKKAKGEMVWKVLLRSGRDSYNVLGVRFNKGNVTEQ